jgi:Trp operon repressor
MVFDIDTPRAILAHEKVDILAPSFYTVDKEKTTAHAVYMLDTPVHRNQHSKQSPQRLFATLESIYGVKLGADAGYSGLVMKTPWYSGHSVYMPDEVLSTVSLTEMADYVDFGLYNAELKASRGREKVITEAYSESRNVQVFDVVRKKAYTLIRQYWGGRYEDWENACFRLTQEAWSVVSAYNSKSAPYLMSEMKATARSIASYTWKKTTPSGFQAYVEMTHLPHQQKARQAKSVESRLIKTQDKREQARELRAGGMTVREIGQILGVGIATISRWTQ